MEKHCKIINIFLIMGPKIRYVTILVYILALPGLSSKSVIRGRGYLSFFVILLSLRKLTQSQRPPSFFLMNRMCTLCGDHVELIKFAAKFSSKNSQSAFYSVC